jgi:hypothetical protein
MVQKPLDIVLGAYWLTKGVAGAKGEGTYFQSPNAAILAKEYDAIDLRANVHVLPTTEKVKYAAFEGRPSRRPSAASSSTLCFRVIIRT